MKGQYVFECFETQWNWRTEPNVEPKWRDDLPTIYRFRFKSPNGKVLFPSHPYNSKAARSRGIAAIRKGVPGAVVRQV